MNNASEKSKKSNNRKSPPKAIYAALIVTILAATVSYKVLTKVRAQQQQTESSQEQFVGTVQVSEQLQDECQKSAEKINRLAEKKEAVKMFAEYRQHAETCREVYFSITEGINLRSEGTYPDLIVDIATIAAQTNKALAVEMLNFAQSLGPWEFYMGPIVCNSKITLEAYIEAFEAPEEKVCYKDDEKNAIITEIKNKDFSSFSKVLIAENVVFVGSLQSDTACPEKISTAIKLAQKATSSGNVSLEVEDMANSENPGQRFVFKSREEDRLALEFITQDNCFKLKSVLIPEQQANE